ncbi:MAG: hypothetical protein K2Z81_06700 [Cyanobacteria bacterium]|nr:hypothetical protein [Cyanobacteriota bacterium]
MTIVIFIKATNTTPRLFLDEKKMSNTISSIESPSNISPSQNAPTPVVEPAEKPKLFQLEQEWTLPDPWHDHGGAIDWDCENSFKPLLQPNPWINYIQINGFPNGKVVIYIFPHQELTSEVISSLRGYGIAHFSPQLNLVEARTPNQVARMAQYILDNFSVGGLLKHYMDKLKMSYKPFRELSKGKINVVCTRKEKNQLEFRPLQDFSWFRTFWIWTQEDGSYHIQLRRTVEISPEVLQNDVNNITNYRGDEAITIARQLLGEVFFLEEEYELVLKKVARE